MVLRRKIMKTASMVFIWISIVLNILSAIFLLIITLVYGVLAVTKTYPAENQPPEMITLWGMFTLCIISFFIYLIYGALNLVLCILSLKELNKASPSKERLLVLGILVLIFVNLIAGILMLVYRDKGGVVSDYNANNSQATNTPKDEVQELKNKLDEINTLRAKGVITESEYQRMREKLFK